MQRTRRRIVQLAATAALAAAVAAAAGSEAASLRGSRGSLDRQNLEARRHDYSFLANRAQVERFVALGYLVPLTGNADFSLKEVSFPFARPAVRTFVERLAAQYRASCDEQLVVTSLTRPRSHQPRNASRRSVHPTGMALDLRRSWNRACRRWLETVLVSLEEQGVLEATYERWPPHYHVALFPNRYERYVDQISHQPPPDTYLVSRGDTLWKIARRHRTTVERVKAENGLRSNRIYPGQLLTVPSGE